MSAQLTLAFARAGGRLVLGSDPNNLGEGRMPGVANHDSIKRAVEIGFSPLETIRMATFDGATFLRIQVVPAASPSGKKPICKSSAVPLIKTFAILITSRSSSRTELRTTRHSCCPESKGW